MGMWLETGMTFRIYGVTGDPSGESQNYTLHPVKTNLRETKGLNVKRKATRIQENGEIILSFWRKHLPEHKPKSHTTKKKTLRCNYQKAYNLWVEHITTKVTQATK